MLYPKLLAAYLLCFLAEGLLWTGWIAHKFNRGMCLLARNLLELARDIDESIDEDLDGKEVQNGNN